MRENADRLLQLIRAVRAREPLPSYLAQWTIDLAVASGSASDRTALRNSLLRRAAALAAQSTWKQMLCIRTELLEVRKLRSFYERVPPVPGSITELVLAAIILDADTPSSERRLLQILGSENLATVENIDS